MPTGSSGRAISVVVADDEPHLVDYLETVLHIEGFTVAGTASDADGAVQACDRLHPDVVLLDLHMPGGGLGAAQLIGSLCPDTRIVIFSASADELDILPLLQSGIDGYVLKGASPDRLAEAVRSAVTGDTYLAPAVGKVAMGALTERLNAEQQAELQRERERSRIADVIASTRFSVVVQPIIDLATRVPTAVEALTRFAATPSRAPDVWIGEAALVGMQASLELAAASQALGELEHLAPHLSISVNVSPSTVLSGRLGEVLLGAPLDRIILEITEHAPVDDYSALSIALAPWRALGARIAVDDAGGGYASFSHILNLKPEFIKLDVTLTQDIHVDAPRQALARAVVGFAKELGVSIVAEGIEQAAQLDVMHALGVHAAQGFHLGRPRPLAEQPDLLAQPAPRAADTARRGIDLSDSASAESRRP